MVRRCVIGFAAFALLAASPHAVSAATIGDLISENCPAAYAVDQQGMRAHALADDSQYAFEKQAAGLYYDCYNGLSRSLR